MLDACGRHSSNRHLETCFERMTTTRHTHSERKIDREWERASLQENSTLQFALSSTLTIFQHVCFHCSSHVRVCLSGGDQKWRSNARNVAHAHVASPPNCPSAGVFCSTGGPTPTSIRRASRVRWPVSVTERAPHHFPANPLRFRRRRPRRPPRPPAVPVVAAFTPTAPTASVDVRPQPPTVHVPAVRSSM